MAKTLTIVNGNPMWIDTESNTSTSWRVWIAALIITSCGIGGFMALASWLMG